MSAGSKHLFFSFVLCFCVCFSPTLCLCPSVSLPLFFFVLLPSLPSTTQIHNLGLDALLQDIHNIQFAPIALRDEADDAGPGAPAHRAANEMLEEEHVGRQVRGAGAVWNEEEEEEEGGGGGEEAEEVEEQGDGRVNAENDQQQRAVDIGFGWGEVD